MENSMLLHYGIKDMKWGVRRYQNKDGTLTAVGEKRYDRDKWESAAKKKENRIDTSNPDSQRWAQEDSECSKQVVNASSNPVREVKKTEQSVTSKSTPKRMDLSKMTDKEMWDRINREPLKQQYNQLFVEVSESSASKDRQSFRTFLSVTEVILGITASVLSIALAIKKLNDK